MVRRMREKVVVVVRGEPAFSDEDELRLRLVVVVGDVAGDDVPVAPVVDLRVYTRTPLWLESVEVPDIEQKKTQVGGGKG
jgi:hypothetical protein